MQPTENSTFFGLVGRPRARGPLGVGIRPSGFHVAAEASIGIAPCKDSADPNRPSSRERSVESWGATGGAGPLAPEHSDSVSVPKQPRRTACRGAVERQGGLPEARGRLRAEASVKFPDRNDLQSVEEFIGPSREWSERRTVRKKIQERYLGGEFSH